MWNSARSARKDATNISTFWVIHYIQAGGFKGPSDTSQAPFLTCRLHRVTGVQLNAARMMVMGAAILPRKLTRKNNRYPQFEFHRWNNPISLNYWHNMELPMARARSNHAAEFFTPWLPTSPTATTALLQQWQMTWNYTTNKKGKAAAMCQVRNIHHLNNTYECRACTTWDCSWGCTSGKINFNMNSLAMCAFLDAQRQQTREQPVSLYAWLLWCFLMTISSICIITESR